MAEWDKYKNGCFQTTCKSLEEFIEVINEVHKVDNRILYRGHSKERDYELISTLDRSYKKFLTNISNIKFPDSFKVIKPSRDHYIHLHLEEFRKRIRGKVDSEKFFDDDTRTWSLGQHHGLDTPYLDWTETPFFATFFCVNSNEDADGCVYALDKGYIDMLNDEANVNEKLKLLVDDNTIKDYAIEIKQPMTNFNTRLNAQNGCFTVTPGGISIDNWIDSFNTFKDSHVLRKIIIKANLKDGIIQFLDKGNINYSTIYPDLEGISKYCNSRLRRIENKRISELQMKSFSEQMKDLEKRLMDLGKGKE